ncbi:MAG: hypothetical protein U5J83_18830 [Bryobacterales bacterium]|nr:hypothetical protein [Bryobacterales bacterium]
MTQLAYPAPPSAGAEDSVYAALREGFHNARFYDREVCAYAGIEDLGAMVRLGDAVISPSSAIDGPLSAMCHLFLWSRAVAEKELRSILGDAFVDAAKAVNLLAPYDEFPGALRALASVYPLRNGNAEPGREAESAFWVVSDRLAGTEEERSARPDDVVFCPLAATGNTFLALLPRTPCDRFVEVCAGCAPAALLASGFAKEVVASDLAGRSVAFARFVARLNGRPQIQALQGASYEGLTGRFDRIAAHPPYMPTLGAAEIYYGGGSTGMAVTEGLVRGLPEVLAPGGLFYAATMIFEGPEKSAEQLVREWLGEDHASYDVLLYPMFFHSLMEAAQRAALKAREGYEGMERAHNFLGAFGFRNAVVGLLLIRRHQGLAPAATVRRRIGEPVDWRHLLWSLETECTAVEDSDSARALSATYRVCPGVEMIVRHRTSPEGFAAAGFKMKTTAPFAIETEIEGWMSYLITRADGSMNGRQLMESCIEDQMIHPETPPNEFAKLLWTFVGGAVLESSVCPLPAAQAT